MPLNNSTDSKTITLVGAVKAAEMANWFDSLPPNADIRIATHKADRNESDYHTITGTWRGHV